MTSLRLLKRSTPAAIAIASGIAMSSPVMAEESVKSKLPIYPTESQPPQVIETHTALESHVGEARKAIVSSTESLRQSVHQNVSKWIGVERRVEKQVLELIPRDEALNPGLLYVGVATLAGSVFGRYRTLPIRLISPPIFFFASLNYFLPKTSHNLSQYYQSVEAAHFPAIKEQRESLVSSVRSLINKSEQTVSDAGKKAESGWKDGLNTVEKNTGLKVA
ncbi:unnamed protein product [Sympodiomycopsis kandeliae]